MNMVNTTYNSKEDTINKLQELKGKTKLKFYKNISIYYNEMKNKNFQTQQDLFSKNAQSISIIYHENLQLMKFLQTMPQVKNLNIKYYDLYYTFLENRKENEVVNIEKAYIKFHDFITPNQYTGIKPRETILKSRNIRSWINHFKPFILYK